MIRFSKEKVLLLHQLMAEATGGSIGVRDEGLLDSALENAFATFDGVELYPSKEEKAARLGFSLVSNHESCRACKIKLIGKLRCLHFSEKLFPKSFFMIAPLGEVNTPEHFLYILRNKVRASVSQSQKPKSMDMRF